MTLDELLRDWGTIRASTRSSDERKFLLETWIKLCISAEQQQEMLAKLAETMPEEEHKESEDGIWANLDVRPPVG